jgi:aminoglycoside phosphotransferase family enzyme
MIARDIHQLIDERALPYAAGKIQIVETHISWVILTENYVYKIKKPVKYAYLDYSTKELRGFYCHEELRLNQRMVKDIYLDVLPVRKEGDKVTIKVGKGKIIDYALLMRRMNESRQMNLLLKQHRVTEAHILSLAKVIADFHRHARVIPEGENWTTLYQEFQNIHSVIDFISDIFGTEGCQWISHSIQLAHTILLRLQQRIEARNRSGYVIDGHGDLHCRNIILEEQPIVFDCIDFSEDFRKLDILSEVAFLCMDMERYGAENLSRLFVKEYFSLVDVLETEEDQQLFLYYKMYRANVLLKVHSSRALAASEDPENLSAAIAEARSYFKMYQKYYLDLLKTEHDIK